MLYTLLLPMCKITILLYVGGIVRSTMLLAANHARPSQCILNSCKEKEQEKEEEKEQEKEEEKSKKRQVAGYAPAPENATNNQNPPHIRSKHSRQ
ncbi:hypothetical protein QBC32DRAFT_42699 [Pseudoneurospora amorphoporcata]|uniref:Uncharacterized protein n=1 Tax=Pseudoneurospora amorphoporcata TaxID=241081 RepID=A0AAN6NNV7_9PEZI|nr:hypothetical protein QBC32DRAFT_42699 [Pseudoneurospora amorphoporcata]